MKYRIKAAFAASVVAVALSGCARQLYFDKPGASTQEFYRDKLACTQTANAGTPGFAALGSSTFVLEAALVNAEARKNMFIDCMQAEGWTPSYEKQTGAAPAETTPECRFYRAVVDGQKSSEVSLVELARQCRESHPMTPLTPSRSSQSF